MRELLIILGLLLSGCATVKPTIADYKIFTKTVQNSNSSSNGCKDKSLKIAQAFSPSSLMSLNMDYMESDNRVFSYSQSQWQESPNDVITFELLKNIRSAGIFSSVEASKSRSKSSWILETNIEEFLQFYTKDMKSSYVNVAVTLTIIDIKTNSVVATKTFSSKADAKTLDAQGGVEALSAALSEVISQNIEWLERVCK
ncbi:MAG: ABC-type transport auxiliary lipoprotein family protein [Sulfurimonas sp.]|nr:ABC-type transport auxiliary lipoprotein family protein [Sulfurimonas sp.]